MGLVNTTSFLLSYVLIRKVIDEFHLSGIAPDEIESL